MIRFRQVEAFRCLMATGTSVGAARRMHITQPAISRLIADLEADLGFRLFNRTKGRLEPTMAAVRFYRAVEENFLGLERLKQAAETIRQEASEGLTVTCQPILSTALLPPILREFFKRKPGMPVKVDTANSPEILVRLQDLKVDIAVCQAFPPIAGIETEPLLEGNVLCAMPAAHPLARKELITPEDLHEQEVIGWLSEGPLSRGMEEVYLPDPAIRPRYTIRTHTSQTRYAMVANGFGISIVEPFAAPMWEPHGVVVRPFQTDARFQYVLAYPSTGIRSDIAHEFREAALAVAREHDFGIATRQDLARSTVLA
ncbi:LysR substrate-binding domain-containing protein [Pseudogulbenkiania subflava]|uniref:DNA-binding transcriptional regulator, LysR family n=1 Tax=Pseudogulbenkiania subflava DSM 22618 TaxID=1123014 RepID=A0A1Y6BZ41_9NEIS|nr:LysR substrate-binding domain-containing protein [Pseudogulbenkiania subflava]SMF36884.1 DNA-binding transcriptional regulator, LysR family [Pseudogulbenkiania subflava DSM 22618]